MESSAAARALQYLKIMCSGRCTRLSLLMHAGQVQSHFWAGHGSAARAQAAALQAAAAAQAQQAVLSSVRLYHLCSIVQDGLQDGLCIKTGWGCP